MAKLRKPSMKRRFSLTAAKETLLAPRCPSSHRDRACCRRVIVGGRTLVDEEVDVVDGYVPEEAECALSRATEVGAPNVAPCPPSLRNGHLLIVKVVATVTKLRLSSPSSSPSHKRSHRHNRGLASPSCVLSCASSSLSRVLSTLANRIH
ncbi:hypothetical protein [Oryza sativa Japonica Group]|uniref:Uncharacterized protein n=1 Tax=Oryza sativa subsp. japonica TaxID=39947 RepID=Q5NAE6_ORYSJ|nr:hypothetical protein [Oryza sativa Japonica Group]